MDSRPIDMPPARRGTITEPSIGCRVLDAIVEHALRQPNAAALVRVTSDWEVSRRITYSQLVRAVSLLEAQICATVEPEGTVVLIGHNSPDFVAWFLAVLAAGRRVFPFHPLLASPEVCNLAAQSGAVAMIATPEHHLKVGSNLISLNLTRVPWDEATQTDHTPKLSQGGGLVLQSSGTTGAPRIVFRGREALDSVAAAVGEAMALAADDRVIAAIPLCHSYGVDILLATLLAGASLHIHEKFDPQLIASECSTGVDAVFPGVPFMFDALSRLRPDCGSGASSLRLAVSAGGPLPQRINDAMFSSWGIRVGQIYGATELGSVTMSDPASRLYDASSVGLPLRGSSVRILAPDNLNRCLPRNEEGHVAVCTPSMLSAYVPSGAPELVDGHLPIGDLGRLDEQGRLFITGRTKLLIDSGGVKISPIEVELALAQHPGVRECVVGPLALSDTVVRLRAVFVAVDPSNPPSEGELRRHMKALLAPYKVPRVFEQVEALPRSPAGKILRSTALREGPSTC
ncbi:MAG: class I adenylate-forming enzyme family protein [Phycisphaerales bacterium]